jgi:hypothetical protein
MDIGPKVKNSWVIPQDSSLSIDGPYTGRARIKLNIANANTWTAQQTFNAGATFGAGAVFNSSVSLNSTTNNAGTFTNSNLFNNPSVFNHTGYFLTNWIAGAIPFIDDSLYLTYNASDYFRNNTTKRYGWGIGTGESILAKHHVVANGYCSGTEIACSAIVSQTPCEAQEPCVWGSYGSCSSIGDETGCNAQIGCIWSAGTPCSTFVDDVSCNAQSPCSWETDYSNCIDLSGSGSGTCNAAGGGGYCSWQSNTCPSYGDSTSCNSAYPCSWFECGVYVGTLDCTNAGCTPSILGDCTTLSDGGSDGTMCATQSECSYDSGSGVCSGLFFTSCLGSTCTGDNSYCGGTTYPSGASCHGGSYNVGCLENLYCSGTAYLCNTFLTQTPCETQDGCDWLLEPSGYYVGDFTVTSGYLRFDKSGAGAPLNADCDSDDERGRFYIDTSANRLYICNGASRGWDYVALTN